MEAYQYAEKIAGDQIRILTLEPSSDENAIVECTLSTVPRDRCGPYEALSYCCGPSTPTTSIVVDNKTFEIRQNLASALRHLRLRDKRRLLWVDAICIHQKNKAERDEQVAHMGETYSGCTRTIVWLGSAEGQSSLAMEAIRVRATQFEGQGVFSVYHSQEPLPVIIRGADSATYLTAIANLLQRPYFTRLWVVQEVCVAPDIVVNCGHDTISFGQLTNFQLSIASCPDAIRGRFSADKDERSRWASLFQGMDYPQIFVRQALQVTQEELAGNGNMDIIRRNTCVFLKLLWSTRHRECEEPEDRFHALRNIALDIDREIFTPKYGRRLESTHAKITLAIIKPSRNLNVLCLCRGPEPPDTDGRQRASWAPHFNLCIADSVDQLLPGTLTNFTGMQPFFTPTADSIAQLRDSDDDCELLVTGYQIGIIDDAAGTQWLEGVIKQTRAIIDARISPDTDDQTRKEIFWRTLIADRARDGSPARTEVEGAEFDLWWDAYSYPTEQLDSTIRSTASHYNAAYYRYAPRRSLFTTDTGLIGLGPQCLQKGDHICLLAGAQTVFTLRPKGKKYQVVGETYVHGIMKGERWKELTSQGIKQTEFVLV